MGLRWSRVVSQHWSQRTAMVGRSAFNNEDSHVHGDTPPGESVASWKQSSGPPSPILCCSFTPRVEDAGIYHPNNLSLISGLVWIDQTGGVM